MARIAGVAYVSVDGDQVPLRGSFTVSPSGITREGIAGQDGVHGHKEMPRVPFIEGEISMDPRLSLDRLQRMSNVTVVAELASGHSYSLRNAFTTVAFEINTEDGFVTVRWEGHECIELLARG